MKKNHKRNRQRRRQQPPQKHRQSHQRNHSANPSAARDERKKGSKRRLPTLVMKLVWNEVGPLIFTKWAYAVMFLFIVTYLLLWHPMREVVRNIPTSNLEGINGFHRSLFDPLWFYVFPLRPFITLSNPLLYSLLSVLICILFSLIVVNFYALFFIGSVRLREGELRHRFRRSQSVTHFIDRIAVWKNNTSNLPYFLVLPRLITQSSGFYILFLPCSFLLLWFFTCSLISPYNAVNFYNDIPNSGRLFHAAFLSMSCNILLGVPLLLTGVVTWMSRPRRIEYIDPCIDGKITQLTIDSNQNRLYAFSSSNKQLLQYNLTEAQRDNSFEQKPFNTEIKAFTVDAAGKIYIAKKQDNSKFYQIIDVDNYGNSIMSGIESIEGFASCNGNLCYIDAQGKIHVVGQAKEIEVETHEEFGRLNQVISCAKAGVGHATFFSLKCGSTVFSFDLTALGRNPQIHEDVSTHTKEYSHQKMTYACGIATDSKGHVYVADKNSREIYRFRRYDGENIEPPIKMPSKRKLSDPGDIEIDDEKKALYIIDDENPSKILRVKLKKKHIIN
jgi:hypothetical protein